MQRERRKRLCQGFADLTIDIVAVLGGWNNGYQNVHKVKALGDLFPSAAARCLHLPLAYGPANSASRPWPDSQCAYRPASRAAIRQPHLKVHRRVPLHIQAAVPRWFQRPVLEVVTPVCTVYHPPPLLFRTVLEEYFKNPERRKKIQKDEKKDEESHRPAGRPS